VVLVVVDARLEIVIIKVEQVRGQRLMNDITACDGAERVIGRREMGDLCAGEQCPDVFGVAGTDKEVLRLGAVGDNGDKAARNV
jgi:hypothetical protein